MSYLQRKGMRKKRQVFGPKRGCSARCLRVSGDALRLKSVVVLSPGLRYPKEYCDDNDWEDLPDEHSADRKDKENGFVLLPIAFVRQKSQIVSPVVDAAVILVDRVQVVHRSTQQDQHHRPCASTSSHTGLLLGHAAQRWPVRRGRAHLFCGSDLFKSTHQLL